MKEFLTSSAEETTSLGYRLGKVLPMGSVVSLFGDLATGKTTFIKGLVNGATGFPEQEVTSPTFTYLNIYPGRSTVYHFDLYRINHAEQFLDMGFDEYFFGEGICCIEWAERIENLLPASSMRVTLEHCEEEQRLIRLDDGMCYF